MTFPAYQSLTEIPAAGGFTTTFLWLEFDGGSWELDPDFLERRIGMNTRVVVVNFPHNPTGFHLSKDRFARVVEICEKHGITLFSTRCTGFSSTTKGSS